MNNAPSFRQLLLPLSWLYGLGMWVRNALFNMELRTSQSYDIPVISVGNLTVGGTGKTPMTEYLVNLLGAHHKVAVLSRGYKRLSKGQQLGTPQSGPHEIGDEPAQILRKFPSTIMMVDADRRRGLDTLSLMKEPEIEAVVMDDAFQHRSVIPGLSILLIDYNRPIHEDHLLPAGNLREPVSQTKRADMLVFTKCPPDLPPIERRLMVKELNLQSHQSAYFTTMAYEAFQPLLKQPQEQASTDKESGTSMYYPSLMDQALSEHPVLILAGIAYPQPFIEKIRAIRPDAQALLFPDHHCFNDKDLARIKTTFEPLIAQGGVIVTTEKDSVRLLADKRFEFLWPYLYTAPINLRFLDEESDPFNKKILDYVHINRRHRDLDQATYAQ
jgi:tetraacyldisaccharide 4'-kinase